MRIKQELKLPKTPRSLWINNKSIQELRNFFPEEDGNIISPETCSHSNKSIQDLREFYPEEERSIISPETCSHRHQQGWQHLPNLPVQNILNNNNNISITNNNNINNNPDEVVTLASSSPHQVDGSGGDEDDVDDYQSQQSHDEDDSDESSSGDEDSSISFSDTSPLLDVSSLDEDSSTSSDDSDEDDDTDMCEDDGIPEDDDNIEDGDDNVDDGFEEEEDDHGCSMDTSWMSVSSAASVDVPSASDNRSQVFDHHRDRNGVVLPDVLPVNVSKANNEEITPDGVKKIVDATLRELTLRVKKRSELKLDPVPRLLSRDCCIVEITTQPDIQVDIRLNSAPSAPGIPISEAYVRHGNAYPPREVVPLTPSIKNYNNHCTKTAVEDIEVRPSEIQSFRSGSSRENRVSPKFFALGEGVRLNNFSIVNGFKAVSLTELVKTDDDESVQPETPNKIETANSISTEEPTSPSSTQDGGDVPSSQTFPEKLPNHSAGGFNLYSKENRRHYKDYATLEQRPCLDVSKPCPVVSSQDNRNGIIDVYAKNEKLKSEPILNHSLNSSVQQLQPKKKTNNVSPPLSKKTDGKLSSPELFEVYTMETAIPHISWAAVGRSNRESDWLKKRRNDREEIRRKLAMDSDNEDYVAEKMVHNQESSSIDRLKGGSNLQICFMNEAAKNTEVVPEAETVIESNAEKTRKPLPKMLMSSLLFPPSLQKNIGNSKVQNNNNSQPQVVKRQRPTFFFNRPRSWHAAKVEEKHDPEEDLFTRHHRLQAEAREALAQAKDMARMQMEIERQKKKKSPIADIVGISFPDGQNSLSRHALLDMNVAQLQVIVNDLHSQIETLNENLVKFLLERDDLHMEQDSMLVDIEDLTRYLGLKGSCSVTHSTDSKLPLNVQVSSNNKKILNAEPVRRSQSVHLKKPKHFL